MSKKPAFSDIAMGLLATTTCIIWVATAVLALGRNYIRNVANARAIIKEKDAAETAVKGLIRKYGDGDDFKVRSVNWEENLQKEFYTIDVYSEKLNDNFTVWVSAGGNGIREQYEYCLYGQQIDSELDAVAEGSGWQVEHFYESYDPAEIDEKRYTFREFKADRVALEITVSISDIYDPDVGESLYRYLTDIHGLGYEHIRLSIKEDSVGAIVLFECGYSHPYLDDYEDKEGFLKRVDLVRMLRKAGTEDIAETGQETPG